MDLSVPRNEDLSLKVARTRILTVNVGSKCRLGNVKFLVDFKHRAASKATQQNEVSAKRGSIVSLVR